jgi:hypothetical protein
MEYICDKIITIKKFENLHIYFKSRVVGFWVIFFMMYDIDVHQLNLGSFFKINFLDEVLFNFFFIF